MAEQETVDIHIRLSSSDARRLEALMQLGDYSSKSRYVEELINAVDDIMELYYLNSMVKKARAQSTEYANEILVHAMLPVLRRLGWPEYRDARDAERQKRAQRENEKSNGRIA